MDKPTEEIKFRLRKALEIRNMTQQELAEKARIPKASISQYLSGYAKPKQDRIYDISKALDIKEAWLLGYDVPMNRSDLVEEHTNTLPSTTEGKSLSFDAHEIGMIEKYRTLDPYGKDAVDAVLKIEHDRCMNSEPHDNVRYINFYDRLVSAGTGQILFDDIPTELIAIPDISEYRTVNYALEVNGGSMEPRFYDGDIILVERTDEVDKGEIGIFVVDNEAYLKELGDQVLVSLNEEYQDIPLNEYSRCIGRVIDKL